MGENKQKQPRCQTPPKDNNTDTGKHNRIKNNKKTNRKVKITNPEIKEAKASRRKHKHNFNAACRNNNPKKTQYQKQYQASQRDVANLIEEETKKSNTKKVSKIIKEGGGANSNLFTTKEVKQRPTMKMEH